MNSDKCFRCGRKGHWARDCVASLGRRGGFLRDWGGSRCYSCGKTDHIQRDCPQRGCGPRCYRCRGLGHMARDCLEYGPLNAQTHGQRCYGCGEKRHIAQDCSMGHLARHCPKDEIKCFNCREIGHIARDCYKSYSYRADAHFSKDRIFKQTIYITQNINQLYMNPTYWQK